MKKLKLFLIALVMIPCAIVMSACGDSNPEKLLNTEAKCDTTGPFEASTLSAVETDLGTNSENATTIAKGFRMTMTSTTGTKTMKVNVIAKQISENNYVMAMKTNEGGVESYAYLSEGYFYLYVNGEKIKVSYESSFFEALPFVNNLDINKAIKDLTSNSESSFSYINKAIEGNTVKYEMSLNSAIYDSAIYNIVFKNNSLISMKATFTSTNPDSSTEIIYEAFDGDVSLPDLSDYSDLSDALIK